MGRAIDAEDCSIGEVVREERRSSPAPMPIDSPRRSKGGSSARNSSVTHNERAGREKGSAQG